MKNIFFSVSITIILLATIGCAKKSPTQAPEPTKQSSERLSDKPESSSKTPASSTCNAICELEKAGVKVDDKLQSRLPQIEELKTEILKAKVREVVDGVEDYDYKIKKLYINEFTSSEDIAALREMIGYSESIGIEIHDYLFRKNKWDQDKKILDGINADILTLKTFISSIEFWNAESEYDISNRRLWLRSADDTESIKAALQQVSKYGPAATKFKDIRFLAGVYSDLASNWDDVVAMSNYFDQFLEIIKKWGAKIIIFNGPLAYCRMAYDHDTNIITVYRIPNDCDVKQMLTTFDEAMKVQSEIGIKVVERYQLGKRILEVSPRSKNLDFIRKHSKELASSSNSIKKIIFAPQESSESQNYCGTLLITKKVPGTFSEPRCNNK